MAKYHVKSDGSFGVCRAEKGKCPLAGDGEDVMHVTSKGEAQQLSENILAIKFERKQKSLSKKSGKEVKDNAAVGVDKMSVGERRNYLKSFDGKVNEFGEKAYWASKYLIWQNEKGEISRSDGPAIENPDGYKAYYYNGELHRLDGPAIEEADGGKEFWVNGVRHRIGGPAIEEADGTKEWYQYDKLHRVGGPAIEYANGEKAYWLDDKKYSEEDYYKKINSK